MSTAQTWLRMFGFFAVVAFIGNGCSSNSSKPSTGSGGSAAGQSGTGGGAGAAGSTGTGGAAGAAGAAATGGAAGMGVGGSGGAASGAFAYFVKQANGTTTASLASGTISVSNTIG